MTNFDTGAKIRELRLAANLSQEQLAEMASLNRVTVAKYEIGRIEPGAQALSRIADALEVSADVLLGKEAEAPASSAEPKTKEARIVSTGMDKMPPAERERVLNILKAAYADYFAVAEDKMA